MARRPPTPAAPGNATPARLSPAALNRALLARQCLLARRDLPVAAALSHLGGLQAQQARPPFIGLWSRLAGFQRDALTTALHARDVVRATTLRGTLHLHAAADYLAHRATLQPALTRGMNAVLGDRARALDLPALLAAARECFAVRPRTFTGLRAELAARFPTVDERAMGYAVRTHLPLVIPPGAAEWAFQPGDEFTLAEAWLPAARFAPANPAALVRRYLAAFGPATPADFQAWSGLAGMAPVFASLRPELAAFEDENGRELFDLPDAPRPPGETPAPVRFIADFDNLILAHADRTRIIADEHRPRVVTKNLLVRATFLVDGRVAGTWALAGTRRAAEIQLEPFAPVPARTRAELQAEGGELARFLAPTAQKWTIVIG